jgi:SAM-dependent methyltransferase
MNFIKNLKFLTKLIYYTSYGFSICKIYQITELKKQNIHNEIIEFGSNSYRESLIKYYKKNKIKIYFSNLFNLKKDNYFQINLENKNKIKKRFKNILAFNVLEHIHNDSKALDQLKRLLKKKGKLYISTPFLYRYHEAPRDYKRYTSDYFEKILKSKKFKIKKKLSLGTGPFMVSYSMIFDYLNKIPLICYPLITICYLLDIFLSLFHKNRINKFYPICILIVAEK